MHEARTMQLWKPGKCRPRLPRPWVRRRPARAVPGL